MKILLYLILTFSALSFIKSCYTNEKSVATTPADKVTFERDVRPIFEASCRPCHFTDGINPNKWDNYDAVKYKIYIIIERVNKEQGAPKFMPKDRNKLSPEAIATLRKWVKDGMIKN